MFGAMATGMKKLLFAEEPSLPNPIAHERKRMGFVIVADTSCQRSFEVAYALTNRVFDRLQFDTHDPIT